MILLIDNYDSFTFNLYQYIGLFNSDIKVIKNDELSVKEILDLKPEKIIISPGPKYPKDAGVCIELIKEIKDIPTLGICLGHQAICEAFGSKITHASKVMHGKKDLIKINNKVNLFKDLNEEINVGRYHSLIATNISQNLEIIALNNDNEVMGVKHKTYPIYGLQFHPESILTSDGLNIIKNFMEIIYE